MAIKLTHLGHACVLVETADARILIDPGLFSSVETVTDLDAVLITHQHPDHVSPAALTALLAANPAARVIADRDSGSVVSTLPGTTTLVDPGDRISIGASRVDVLGGLHAPVYADVPGCTNASYLVDDGAFFHPGDSFFVPPHAVDVLAVAIDGPWLKLSEAVDFVAAVGPRRAVPIHEGETTDPAKYAGMLAAFSPSGVVQPLPAGEATTI